MDNRIGRSAYAGLFLVAMATLMYEVLLTRIFSVTMWYHFAFVAISVAMFGMTLGAVLVHVLPRCFAPELTRRRMAQTALAFSLTAITSFTIHLFIPFQTQVRLSALLGLMGVYLVITIPFIFSGICVCLALTRHAAHVGKLYAADLAGAAVGCVAVVVMLEVIDGPTLIFVVAMLAAAAAACFAVGSTWIWRSSAAAALVLLGLGTANVIMGAAGRPFIRLWWVKGTWEAPARYERWNSFSRVRVEEEMRTDPAGWGLSLNYPKDHKIDQLYLNIDSNAGTNLTRFDGNLDAVDFLKYDVTNLVHYIRPNSNVLVVGTGGGRDILSALAFEQKSVTGVEINGQIIRAVTRTFADFTGHLDQRPGVHFVNDEARSYIARSRDRFDIIQISLIDTWAATAAGAYVLSENSLYTVDAWDVFLQHLSARGVLSVSRWFYSNRPGETWRVVSLANASLRKLGIEDPQNHIMVIKSALADAQVDGDLPDAVATVLVSRAPFTVDDVTKIAMTADQMRFDVVLSPITGTGPLWELARTRDIEATTADLPLNLAPPTDNQPFFFNMARFRDMFGAEIYRDNAFRVGLTAVGVLGGLLIFVTVLAVGLVVVPIAVRSQLRDVAKQAPLSVYFLAIGVAFMLIEISQMQRLVVLLGHPTYSLSVVLFTLLVSSGLGSYTTSGLHGDVRRSVLVRLCLLLGVLIGLGLVTPGWVHSYQASTTPVRIALAIALLAPAGLFMGMAFPLGLTMASRQSHDISAWLWSINGAASIVASVLAVVLAMAWGINMAWWTGVGCYGLAMLMALFVRDKSTAQAAVEKTGAASVQ